MAYFYFKALHIVFVVSWFSGLFYMVRFFVYHSEALEADEPKRTILHEEYMKNERLLYHIITMPAMTLSLITGLLMIYSNPVLMNMGWFHIKLTMLVGLMVYHFHLGYIMGKFKQGISIWSSIRFRLWNEVGTLFLVAIVFVVVLKNNINWLWGTLGFIAFAILIMAAVKIVKRFRQK